MRQKLATGWTATGQRWAGKILAEVIYFVVFIGAGFLAFVIVAATILLTTMLFGKEYVAHGLVTLGAFTLTTVYTLSARILWRNYPPPPGPFWKKLHWLLTVYKQCWQKGLVQEGVRRAYCLLIIMGVAVFTVGPLIYTTWHDVAVVAFGGLSTPALALITLYTPFAGLLEKKKTETKSEGS